MAQTRRDSSDEPADDRILSDFSTDPELLGYSHKTWATAVALLGFVLVALPQLFSPFVAIPLGVGALLVVGVLFSATPPHLSPWAFAYRRITHGTQQRIYVPDRSGTMRNDHSANTKNDNNE